MMNQASSPFAVSAFYGTPRKKFRSTLQQQQTPTSSPSQSPQQQQLQQSQQLTSASPKTDITRPLFSTLHRRSTELFDKVAQSSTSSTSKLLLDSKSNNIQQASTVLKQATLVLKDQDCALINNNNNNKSIAHLKTVSSTSNHRTASIIAALSPSCPEHPSNSSDTENVSPVPSSSSSPVPDTTTASTSTPPIANGISTSANSSSSALRTTDANAPLPLKNLGNTCYENSIVQCLFSLSTFMKLFKHVFESTLNDNASPAIDKNDARYKVSYAFKQLYDTYIRKRIQLKTNSIVNVCDNVMVTDEDNDDCNMSVVLPVINDDESNVGASSSPSNYNDEFVTKSQSTEQAKQQNTELTEGEQTAVPNSESPVPLTADSELDEKLTDLKLAVGERSAQFNSTHQQDASEFFYHVIDTIQEFFQDIERICDEENPVTNTFEFELDYFVTCVKCGHRAPSETEKIRTLPLAIPEDSKSGSVGGSSSSVLSLWDNRHENNRPLRVSNLLDDKENKQDSQSLTLSSTESEISLQGALINYFREDPMEFKCSQSGCDSKEKTRKCMIRKLPKVLFITLARYSHSGQKNLDDVRAPFEIQVPLKENKSPNHSPSAHRDGISDDDSTYQLVAVVCHLGSSLNAGHYTAYVYNQNNGSWYSCDDDAITKSDVDRVERDARRSGYCFFYAHKSSMEYPQVPSTTTSNLYPRIW